MKTVKSLLIVDDSTFDEEITEIILERTGRFEHVYSVSDGKEALDLFLDYNASRAKYPDQFPPLIILLDINMPVMDGFDLLDAYAGLDLRHADLVELLARPGAGARPRPGRRLHRRSSGAPADPRARRPDMARVATRPRSSTTRHGPARHSTERTTT